MVDNTKFVGWIGRRRRISTAVLGAALAALTVVSGPSLQAQKTGGVRFEVASVRPNNSETPAGIAGGAGGPNIGVRGGRLVAVNLPLRDIIRYAYQLEPFQQMQGSPRWFEDRFDINAVIPPSVSSVDGPRLMLQTLLAERFALRVRWATEEQPVYALVVARRDKRLGPGLKPSTMDCEAWRAKQPETPPLESVLSGRATCDMIFQPFRARIFAGARTMTDLASFLARLPPVGAPVQDRTGLTGPFDFELVFAPGRPGAPADSAAARDGRPSVFVALDEQLGLRLERTRGPVQVLVIERAEPLSRP